MTKDQDQPIVLTDLGQPKEPNEPFAPHEVKKRLARSSAESLTFSNHALERMEERDIQSLDVCNVLRGGAVQREHCECVAGRWRYCIETSKFRVIFVFEGESALIITAIRRE